MTDETLRVGVKKSGWEYHHSGCSAKGCCKRNQGGCNALHSSIPTGLEQETAARTTWLSLPRLQLPSAKLEDESTEATATANEDYFKWIDRRGRDWHGLEWMGVLVAQRY